MTEGLNGLRAGRADCFRKWALGSWCEVIGVGCACLGYPWTPDPSHNTHHHTHLTPITKHQLTSADRLLGRRRPDPVRQPSIGALAHPATLFEVRRHSRETSDDQKSCDQRSPRPPNRCSAIASAPAERTSAR